MTTRARWAGLLTAITLTAALAACSSSSDNGESSGEVERPDGMAVAPESAGNDGAKDSTGLGAADSAPGADAGARGSVSTVEDPASPPSERAVISTGTVSLQSRDVAEARRDVQRVVDAQGGDITDESTETADDGTTSYSRMVVRVPGSRFGAAMLALEEAAGLVSSNRGSQDVTTQVIDTDVRVRAQEASLKRVELLLSRARSLKDIIWIESQLTHRQAELDSLKSQQSWLEDQTSLSTITVDITLTSEEEEGPDEDQEAGFLVGLKGGMDALAASLSALATVVGALLPFAILLLLVGLPVGLVARRRRTPPTAPGDAGGA